MAVALALGALNVVPAVGAMRLDADVAAQMRYCQTVEDPTTPHYCHPAAVRLNVEERPNTWLGIAIRAGLHTGEVRQREDGGITGIAVHVGARIAALAGAGEILVSRETIDQAASRSDLENRGAYQVKGLPRPVVVFCRLLQTVRRRRAPNTGSSAFTGLYRQVSSVGTSAIPWRQV